MNSPRYHVLGATLALLLGSGVVASASEAESPLADGLESDDVLLGDRRGIDDMPVAPFDVHEWGVWRVGRDGAVASLEELVRESPPFVHRSPDVAGTELPEPVDYGVGVCDKPVIFFHATADLDVTVRVGFNGGRPWLIYPDATLGTQRGVRTASWTGHISPSETLPEGRSYPTAYETHWWNILRRVGASPFQSASSPEAERFLFYDGTTQLPRGFRARLRGPQPISGAVDPVAWSFDGTSVWRLAIEGRTATRTPLASRGDLRADMLRVFVERGLSQPEAASLLDTWRSNLFEGSGRRIFWMLPRAAYDRMLPIAITPAPRSLVRLGLVIQEY